MDRQLASARRTKFAITSEPLAVTLSSSSVPTAARLASPK
jgi:hypothetical protein